MDTFQPQQWKSSTLNGSVMANLWIGFSLRKSNFSVFENELFENQIEKIKSSKLAGLKLSPSSWNKTKQNFLLYLGQLILWTLVWKVYVLNE